ncbi:hypothetical protein T03_16562 [Trichinella britovi]|uniref:Uncharacterized protein n=1 Tax=Trichinella britovi TaxID=45882 RepID=A0A0V1CCZ2_TRIBR|nr:hypothetical protein T03_16562 [Trichinella britovi]
MLRIHGAVGDTVHRKSLSTFNLLRCCMLSAMIAENPPFHKCALRRREPIYDIQLVILPKHFLRHKDVEFRFHGSFLKIMWKMFDDH